MKKIVLAGVILPLFISSCAFFSALFGDNTGPTKIVRWPEKSGEKHSHVLQGEFQGDIFNDFLWTTPDLHSRKLNLSIEYGVQKLDFTFDGSEYEFKVIDHTKLEWTNAPGGAVVLELRHSENDRYYDISLLKIVSVTEQRWVPKTEVVPETVPVTRSRMVPQTITNADGTSTTIMTTEFYTDFETHFVTKTTWDWETYSRSMVDIPRYSYFELPLGKPGRKLLIYQVAEGDTLNYYLQNPSYLTAMEKDDGFLKMRDVRIMILDNNSNGSYSDPEDLILFNVWNPYAKESTYRSIQGLMDNKWFDLLFLENDYFLTIETGSDGLINFINQNDQYVGVKTKGKLIIDNQSGREGVLFVNGRQYRSPQPGQNEYSIEFGKYNLILSQEGFIDYRDTFVINHETPEKVVVYNPEDPAGTLRLTNIFAENWSVEYSLPDGPVTLFNTSELRLPPGNYPVTITVDGLPLTWSVTIKQGGITVLNYEEEIQKIKQE